MKKIFSVLAFICAFSAHAQKVEIAVGDAWMEIPAQQTQSELKPGWKIVDYQMKSRLIHYLSGSHASQLADGEKPVFRVIPGPNEVLLDYALIRLKRYKTYRKLPKVTLLENEYTRLELSNFNIKSEDDSFICQPLQPLSPGEYILVSFSQKPIGDLQDLLVYPFCVMKLPT